MERGVPRSRTIEKSTGDSPSQAWTNGGPIDAVMVSVSMSRNNELIVQVPEDSSLREQRNPRATV